MRWMALLTLLGVNALGQPRPLRPLSTARAAQEISILRVDLQDLKPAHDGPSYFTAKRAPFRGQAEVAEASVFGQEAVAWLRFEMLDETGRVLGVVPTVRTGSAVDSDGYMLKLQVPNLPFRVRIVGADLRGRTFVNVYRRLFVPMEGAPSAAIPPELDAQFQAGDLRMTHA